MMRHLLCGLLCVLGAATVQARCLQTGLLQGVNLAGPEFNGGQLPGVLNKDYVYPQDSAFDYFAAIGANTIRLPFRWERIQPSLFGALDAAELQQIAAAVASAKSRGMCIILDVHNYGAYRGLAIGAPEVPLRALSDLWLRLHAVFNDPRVTVFGLMNEPSKLPIDLWAKIAQQTVQALRSKGAQNLILVSGGRWSGVHEWEKVIGETSNAQAFAQFQDPLQRTWLEVHQYADRYYAGTGQTCVPAAKIAPLFGNITRWAKTHQQRLFLGEFGTPANAACLAALEAMLAQMQDARVWRGWTYWAAGSWWGDYPLSIEPRNGQDAPQTAVLKKYFSAPISATP